MRKLFRVLLALEFAFTVADLCLVPASAFADTVHYREAVTFMAIGGIGKPNCLYFQTDAGGGVYGIDNSNVGDAGAPLYTGLATRYAIGLGSDVTSIYTPNGDFMKLMVASSRYSNKTLLLNFTDRGANTTSLYNDCGVATAVDAVSALGQ